MLVLIAISALVISSDFPATSSSGVEWAKEKTINVAHLNVPNSLILAGVYYRCSFNSETNCVDENAVIKFCDLSGFNNETTKTNHFPVYSVEWMLYNEDYRVVVTSMDGQFTSINDDPDSRKSGLIRYGRTRRKLHQTMLNIADIDTDIIDTLTVVKEFSAFLQTRFSSRFFAVTPVSIVYAMELFPSTGIPFIQERIIFLCHETDDVQYVEVVRMNKNNDTVTVRVLRQRANRLSGSDLETGNYSTSAPNN